MIIQHIDREKNKPTIVGPYGAAWELDRAAIRNAHGRSEESDATVAAWIVHSPRSHPLWPYVLIAAIHLRDLPGLGPAKINLAGATHEVRVDALDPRVTPDFLKPQRLVPPNFIGQWRADARPNPVDLDRAAAAKIRSVVEEIVAGNLSPDTDFRSEWIHRFSDSNIRQ